jgi:hypothetical protein
VLAKEAFKYIRKQKQPVDTGPESVNPLSSETGPKSLKAVMALIQHPVKFEEDEAAEKQHNLARLLALKMIHHRTLYTVQNGGTRRRLSKNAKLLTNRELERKISDIGRKIRQIAGQLFGRKFDTLASFEQFSNQLAVSEIKRPLACTADYLLKVFVQANVSIGLGIVRPFTPYDNQPAAFQPLAVRDVHALRLFVKWTESDRDVFYRWKIAGASGLFRQWEEDNYDKLKDGLTTDGDSIGYVGELVTLVDKKESVPKTKGRSFNSGTETEFKFSFEGEVDWDEQIVKFRDVGKIASVDKNLVRVCKAARPATKTSWIATYVYLAMLKDVDRNAFDYLMGTGFLGTSVNIDNYQKQCKKFTSFLKLNKDSVEGRYNFNSVNLFELEQLTGFRTRSVVPDWKENIEDWVSYKSNMNTPVSAYLAHETYRKEIDTSKWSDPDVDDRYIKTASVYNADGTAKGERLSMETMQAEFDFIPKAVRLNKTGYNMLLTTEERVDLAMNDRVMYGYPVQKKEVTKVRYIINTDLGSHFQLSPLESLLASSLSKSSVYNMNSTEDQVKTLNSWLQNTDDTMFCADQSSFDHYCSKASFFQLFLFCEQRLSGLMCQVVRKARIKFSQGAIFVTSDRATTRWQSGMLSGWKITSIGDSLINLTQMSYAIRSTGRHEYRAKVQGDDVMMQSRTVEADRVTTSMNAMGLVQHPDKTINSKRYCEFLRVLTDAKKHVRQGYAARMMSSLVYSKPWVAQYSSKEWSGDSVVQRIKAWRTLCIRMSGKYTTEVGTKFAVEDVRGAMFGNVGRERLKVALSKPLVAVGIGMGDREKAVAKLGPKGYSVSNGRVDEATLKNIVATNLTTQGRMTIKDVVGYEGGSTVMREVSRPVTVPLVPWPQSWIKKLMSKLKPVEFVRLNMLWGRDWARHTGNYRMFMQNPGRFEFLVRNELYMKTEMNMILPVTDDSVSLLLKTIKSEVQYCPTTEELREKMSNMYEEVNWLQSQKQLYYGSEIHA